MVISNNIFIYNAIQVKNILQDGVSKWVYEYYQKEFYVSI